MNHWNYWKLKGVGFSFISTYERDRKGERIFVLTRHSSKGNRRITFESWQMAKSMGWVKQ